MGEEGIRNDEERRQRSRALALDSKTIAVCGRCGGTGNELYSMYRECEECKGLGTVKIQHGIEDL